MTIYIIIMAWITFMFSSTDIFADTVTLSKSAIKFYEENVSADDVKSISQPKNAIIDKEDSTTIDYWYLSEKKVIWVSQRKDTIVVHKQSKSENIEIINNWFSIGFKAKVIDKTNKTFEINNIYLKYTLPSGYVGWGFGPQEYLSIPLVSGDNNLDVNFKDIESINFGKNISIRLRDGKNINGELLQKHVNSVSLVPTIYGVISFAPGSLSNFEKDIIDIKSITFLQ